jgi:hypothetical protein
MSLVNGFYLFDYYRIHGEFVVPAIEQLFFLSCEIIVTPLPMSLTTGDHIVKSSQLKVGTTKKIGK